MNYILCGLPNSGKTTVGQLLAKKLSWSFIDTDRLIEEQQGRSCREIFQKEGELIFRALEKKVIASLAAVDRTVIATGGGSLLDSNNRSALQQLGRCVYLKAANDALIKRFHSLPAYLASFVNFSEFTERRRPFYEEIAHIVIETDHLAPEEIADMILYKLTLER